jgi:acyl carrier protein
MTKQEILARFAVIASAVTLCDSSKVVPEARIIEDLGADSLDFVSLTMRTEEAFQIYIDDEEMNGLETVQQVLDLIEKKKKIPEGVTP